MLTRSHLLFFTTERLLNIGKNLEEFMYVYIYNVCVCVCPVDTDLRYDSLDL